MKRFISALMVVLTIMLSAFALCVNAEDEVYFFDDERFIVVLNVDATRQVIDGKLKIDNKFFKQYGIDVKKVWSYGNCKYEYYVYLGNPSHENVLNAIEILKKEPLFEYIDPDWGDGDSGTYDKYLHLSSDGNYLYRFRYENTGGIYGIRLSKYVGNKKLPASYVLPQYIDEYTVHVVSKGAFKNINSIKTLTVIGFTRLDKLAFYNCKNLKTVKTNPCDSFGKRSVGYYKGKKIKGFRLQADITDGRIIRKSENDSIYYAVKCGFDRYLNLSSKVDFVGFEKSGISFRLRVDGKKANNWKSSNSKIVKVSGKGKAVLKNKGSVKLTAVLKNGKTYTERIKIIKK